MVLTRMLSRQISHGCRRRSSSPRVTFPNNLESSNEVPVSRLTSSSSHITDPFQVLFILKGLPQWDSTNFNSSPKSVASTCTKLTIMKEKCKKKKRVYGHTPALPNPRVSHWCFSSGSGSHKLSGHTFTSRCHPLSGITGSPPTNDRLGLTN